MAKCRGVCLKESNQILNYRRKNYILDSFPNDIPKSGPLWFTYNQDGELIERQFVGWGWISFGLARPPA
jgi:hypothetical protein